MSFENNTSSITPLLEQIRSNPVLTGQLADLVFLEEVLRSPDFDTYIPYFVRFLEGGVLIDERVSL